VGQQKSLLFFLPHSSGGISAADTKKRLSFEDGCLCTHRRENLKSYLGLSFFIALTKFFTKPSFIRSIGKNTFAASTKGS
jgi:hypothetical protein